MATKAVQDRRRRPRQQFLAPVLIVTLFVLYQLAWMLICHVVLDSWVEADPEGVWTHTVVEPCTFAQLQASFGSRAFLTTVQTHQQSQPSQRILGNGTNNANTTTASCWSLAEEILRVPVQAIVNRNRLESLGRGKLGGVHLAHIAVARVLPRTAEKDADLSSTMHQDKNNNTPSRLCAAALKTDQCHVAVPSIQYSSSSSSKSSAQSSWSWLATVTTTALSWTLYWQRPRSCIDEMARPWRPTLSYLGAEYTGALVWYAQLQQTRQQQQRQAPDDTTVAVPGLLPTWAVVTDASLAATTAPPPKPWVRFPHPDPTVRGVLLPLQPMTPLSTILLQVQQQAPHGTTEDATTARAAFLSWSLTVPQLAQRMLPAAQGLAFVGDMGLAFRDLLEKNVAWTTTPVVKHDSHKGNDNTAIGSSLVYDHSYMGFDRNAQHPNCGVSCQFCPDDPAFPPFADFYHTMVKGIPKDHPYVIGDAHNFRAVVSRLAMAVCVFNHDDKNYNATVHNFREDLMAANDAHDLVTVLKEWASHRRRDDRG